MPDLATSLDAIGDFLDLVDDARTSELMPYLEDISEAADGLRAVTDHLTAPEARSA